MKLAQSAIDGDEKTFEETFCKFSDSWMNLRYTLKSGISLMLKDLEKKTTKKKKSLYLAKGDNFDLTLTFLQIVVFAKSKCLKLFLDLLDKEIKIDEWLEEVTIGGKNIGN